MLFGELESILIFVGHVIRTLFVAGKLSFSLTSLQERYDLKVRFSSDTLVLQGNSVCHCKVRLEFFSV